MKNLYRTSVWVLLILISLFSCFYGKFDFEITGFNVILGVKTMLMFTIILLIVNIPNILTMIIDKRGAKYGDK